VIVEAKVIRGQAVHKAASWIVLKCGTAYHSPKNLTWRAAMSDRGSDYYYEDYVTITVERKVAEDLYYALLLAMGGSQYETGVGKNGKNGKNVPYPPYGGYGTYGGQY
jgi:hypothetical protein